ncbi:MAG: hypothetical protein WKF73_08905 [Nocardioidaceae bacterium]
MHSLSTTWQGGQRRLLALLSVGLLCAATAVLAPSTTASAATSADGRIAFYGYQDGDADIYTINPDGTGETNLTNEDPGAETLADADPSWSPDGTRIAYTVYTVRSGLINDIWVMNADGTNKVALTDTGNDGAPVWSPDGSQIAFVSDRDGNPEIFVMNADGSNQRQLTFTAYPPFAPMNVDPVWSPDGSRIAFATNREGAGTDFDIYVMNSDGSDAVNLTQNTGSGQAGTTGDRAPAWSPDGSKIAFWTDRDVTEMCSNGCDREIYWMNPDGTGQQNLTSAPGADDYDPTFSPDGSQIAFNSNRDGDYALYSLDVSTVPQPAISGTTASRAPDTGSVADRATVSLITSTYAQGADWQSLPRPRALACTLVGSAGPDVLYGNASADVLCGRAGDDSLRGHGGSDILRGNRGGDNLLAGRGSDRLFGGSGADTLESDDGIGGNDRVDGGPGHDICLIDIGDVTRGCEEIRRV